MGRNPNKGGEWSKKGHAEAIQTGVGDPNASPHFFRQ